MTTSPTGSPPLLLFDGVCNLCNGAVKFVIQHERNAGTSPPLMFAALQSDAAARVCQGLGLDIRAAGATSPVSANFAASSEGSAHMEGTVSQEEWAPADGFQTVVFFENGKVYTRSDAILRLSKHLSFPWSMVYGFVVVPRGLRDWVYDVIANNRQRWFGVRHECMVPTKELRDRFLE